MDKTVDELLGQLGGRAFNFCAGPAPIPQAVLEQARDELLNWHNCGASVMEVSHRTKAFIKLAEESEQDLRALLAIPDHYSVLFLQGGARGQFAAVPMNIKGERQSADYINSGYWAQSAIKEAQRYIGVNVAADGKALGFGSMPEQQEWRLDSQAAYVHYTPNETIGGLEFPFVPDTGEVPLVADMSSSILSRSVDIERFGIIYAGAQKNIGPAGLTVAIVRKDLLERTGNICPAVLDYKLQSEKNSMYNTPPTFAWYLAGLVFKWLKDQGGIEAMEIINKRKAEKLYAMIDKTGFYQNNVDSHWRSKMNVPFTLADPSLDDLFLKESEQAGFLQLKGHKAVGGMRASIYNAIPESHVDALIDFMGEFERGHG
ncbi:3-phosphoserine/phosphohydroxythreonine transaminase [Endozoicomonas sp. Mp262]|uniref:3-phosphoserine/phosphohydroxythreonine transaminase n=1 Tax=Endozoicomonas sp. Mp262 TaxID=2919499 RepID=UPI0021D8D811